MFYSHYTKEETEAQKLYSFISITQLVSARIQIQVFCFQKPYTFYFSRMYLFSHLTFIEHLFCTKNYARS